MVAPQTQLPTISIIIRSFGLWEVSMVYAGLTGILLVLAIQAIRETRLIVSALWLAGVSAVLSVVLYLMDAHVVAVIELSVGAGLVTVLFVFAINFSGEEAATARAILPKPLSWGLVILSALLLGWLTLHLESPNPAESDIPVVEATFSTILWEDRGLDVLVQVMLIFAGTLGLLGLLAEAKAPLQYPVAEEVATERERELQVLEETAVEREVVEEAVEMIGEGEPA
jgi:NADH:ubiquinone oxidoreductase subunit 6 (subunit J)